MENAPLIIRVDAGPQIGTGHVMRSLALAHAWRRRGGHVLFVTATTVPALDVRLRNEGLRVIHVTAQPGSDEDAAHTIAIAREWQPAWVVVDGYHFSSQYQRRLKDAGQRLFVIDDYGHAQHYSADVVLNQNLHAHEELYAQREATTRLLLGPRYSLLRQEFVDQRHERRKISQEAQRILVTLGGSDPENVTSKVVRALPLLTADGLEATIVVGASNAHLVELRALVARSRFPIHVAHNVADLSQLMQWADIAVSAAGSTAWELVYLGLPSLLIVLAENQRPIATQLERASAAINLGWHLDLAPHDIAREVAALRTSTEKRLALAQHSQTLVDGYGAHRVVMTLMGDPFYLRRV